MDMTPEQWRLLEQYIQQICNSTTGAGEITIVIRNGHVRSLIPRQLIYFPKPGEEQRPGYREDD